MKKITTNINFLKLGVLLFGVSLLLWNCEKEDDAIESNQQVNNSNIQNKTIENLSLSQLDNEPLFNEVTSFFGIKSILEKPKVEKGKSLNKKANQELHIDTKDVIKIEGNDYTSYTFFVDRGNKKQHEIENLVIEKKQDTIRGFFIKYIFSQRYMDSIHKNVQIPFDGIIERTPYKENINELLESLKNSVDTSNLLAKSSSRILCFDTYVIIKVKCRSGKHDVGEACSLSGNQRAYSYTISVTICIYDRGGGSSSSGYSGLGSISTDSYSGGEGGDTGSGSYTSPNIPCDDIIHGCDKVVDRLASRLGLDENQTNWIRNEENLNLIEDFLDENPNSSEAESFAKLAIEALIPNIPVSLNLDLNNIISIYSQLEPKITSSNLPDYKAETLRMTAWLKVRGNREFGEYIESLVPDFNTFTIGQVQEIYNLVREQYLHLKAQYLKAVFTPVLEAVTPFIAYAIIDASLGVAIPLLSKIPLSMVLRGAKLEKVVRKVGLLGIRGSNNTIRIVTTSSPVQKAEELFATLTKNAISKTTQSNGTIIANMGNGNIIKYRPLSASRSGYPATIDLYFLNIWTRTRNIKFN